MKKQFIQRPKLFLALTSLLFFPCCDQKNGDRAVEIISIREVEEDYISEPPPSLSSKSSFSSITAWLTGVCQEAGPSEAIENYEFALFEQAGQFTLSIEGIDVYQISDNRTQRRVVFTPKHQYYPLPMEYYYGLTREDIWLQISKNLKDFFSTPTFQQSYLSNCKEIKTAMGVVWHR